MPAVIQSDEPLNGTSLSELIADVPGGDPDSTINGHPGDDVILIEPGLIRTGFSEAAVGGMSEALARPGPYEAFNRAVARATKESYEKGLFSRLGGEPDDVAKAIARALAARRPRARYPVTASAHARHCGLLAACSALTSPVPTAYESVSNQ